MEDIKKISAKTVMGNVGRYASELKDNEKKALYNVGGRVCGYSDAGGAYGGFGFVGQFEAINLVSGEHFRANKCFLQEPYQSSLIKSLEKHDSVEFAVRVSIRREANAVGYSYILSPLLNIDGDEGMKKVRALLENKK